MGVFIKLKAREKNCEKDPIYNLIVEKTYQIEISKNPFFDHPNH